MNTCPEKVLFWLLSSLRHVRHAAQSVTVVCVKIEPSALCQGKNKEYRQRTLLSPLEAPEDHCIACF